MPLDAQFYAFGLTVFLGFIIGILFDFYDTIRSYFKIGKMITALGDFFFWLLMAAIAFTVLLNANLGELRLYVFIGAGLGFFLYKKMLSRYLIMFLKKLILPFVAALIRFIKRFFTFPFIVFKKPMITVIINIKTLLPKITKKR